MLSSAYIINIPALGLMSDIPTICLYSELSRSVIAKAALFHESSVEFWALFTRAVGSSNTTTS